MRTDVSHLSQFKIDDTVKLVLGEVDDWTSAFFSDVSPQLPQPNRDDFKEVVWRVTEALRPYVVEAVERYAAAHPELYERDEEDLRQEYEAGEEYR